MIRHQDTLRGLCGTSITKLLLSRLTRQVSEFTSAERLLQPATSADSFLRLIVALLIVGRAQKPTLRTNPNVT
jgi:hypothetical protein